MNILTSRFQIKADQTAEFEAAIKRLFTAIQKKRVPGVDYVFCRLSNEANYLGFLLLNDGVENPLPSLPEGKAFLENLPKWLSEPPQREQLSVIAEYRSAR
jgi:hypothetical protein